MQIRTIRPSELCELIKSGEALDVIDVRTPAEFRDAHVDAARCVPLHMVVSARIMADRPTSAEPIDVICQSGARGREACRKFAAAGYDNVVNVEGGTLRLGGGRAAGRPRLCGLPMLLARVPWNQSDVSTVACEQPRVAT